MAATTERRATPDRDPVDWVLGDASDASGERSVLDSTKLFYRTINRHPLLTVEDEIALAKAAERGDVAAREKLIISNLRLVAHTARRFRGHGVPFLDLVQEGAIGLATAVEKYEWRRGYRLATYAMWWIHQACQRAIEKQGGAIRLPSRVFQRQYRLWRLAGALEGSLGRPPSVEELARASGFTVDEVRETAGLVKVDQSLDCPVGDGYGATHLDLLPDDDVDVFEEVAEAIRGSRVHEALASLDEPDRRLLELRFGFDGSEGRTQQEIGREFGISRDRVRHAESAALDTLRQLLEPNWAEY